METMKEMIERVRNETRERIRASHVVSLDVALRANESARGIYHGTHGRPADAARGIDITGPWVASGAPEGTNRMDRANKGWANAWARANTTRAGKSERKSVRVGSQTGAGRGERDERTASERYVGII